MMSQLSTIVIGGVTSAIVGILTADLLKEVNPTPMCDENLPKILNHLVEAVSRTTGILRSINETLMQSIELSAATRQAQDRLERTVAEQRSILTVMSDLMHAQTAQLADLAANHVTVPKPVADPHTLKSQGGSEQPAPPAPKPADVPHLDKARALVQEMAQNEEVQASAASMPANTLSAEQTQTFVRSVTATIQQARAQWNSAVTTFGDPKGLTDEGKDAFRSQLTTVKVQLCQALEEARSYYGLSCDFEVVSAVSDDPLDEYVARKAVALCQYADAMFKNSDDPNTKDLTDRFETYEKLALAKTPTLLDRAPNDLALHGGKFLSVTHYLA